MAVQTVSINFLANATQANTAINQLQRNLGSFQRMAGGTNTTLGRLVGGFNGMLGPMAAVAGAYVAIATAARLASNAVKTNMDFEATMLKVKSVVAEDGGDVGKNFQALSEKAREVGTTTRYSATQAAEGLEALVKSGKTAKQAIDMLVPTLYMAQAGDMELGDAAEKLADIMSAFGAEAIEAAHYADILALAAAKSTTDISGMAESFKYAGSISGGMKQSFDDLAVAFGVLANKGIKSSMAGTAVRGVLIQLASASGAAHKKLLELGLTAGDILPSKMNSLADIMKKLKDAGVDANSAYAIFGQRAGVAANIFTDFYNDLVKFDGAMQNVDGSAKRMADVMDESLEASTLKLKNAWGELMLTLGDTGIMGSLAVVVDALAVKINQLAELIKVFTNAAAAGQLGNVLLTMFKYVAMEGANLIFSALTLAFKLVIASFYAQIQLLADPNLWFGIFGMLVGVINGLSGIISLFIAAVMEAAAPFLMVIVSAMHKFENGLEGSMKVVGGLLMMYITKAVVFLLESFRGAGELLGIDVDGAINKAKGIGEDGVNLAKAGGELIELPDSFYREKAETYVRGAYEGIRENGDASLATAGEQVKGAAFLLKESIGANFADPLGKVLNDHQGTDIFDVSKAENEIADAYARFRPNPTVLPEDGKKKDGEGDDYMGERIAGGLGLAGSNRMATNLIMGRTINEVIAQVASKQLDVMEDMLTESQKTSKSVGKIAENMGNNEGTF
jgi:TP901 family phage tail tape measure protein